MKISRRWSTTGLGRAGLVAGVLLGLAAVAGAASPPAGGRESPRLPDPLTHEAVRDLMARLSDAEVRELLLAQLDRAATPASATQARPASGGMMGMVEGMASGSQTVRDRAGELVRGALALPGELLGARRRFIEGRGSGQVLIALLAIVIMLGVGAGLEALYRRVVRRQAAALLAGPGEGLAMQAGRLVLGLALDTLGLAVFAGGGLALFFAFYQGHAPTRLLVLSTLAAVVVVRAVAILSRLLLAPGDPSGRLLPFDDAGARRLHRGAVTLAALYGFGRGWLTFLARLDMAPATIDVLSLALGAAFLAVALDLIWRLRPQLGRLVRGPGSPGPMRWLVAELLPVLLTAYLVIVYLVRVEDMLTGEPPSQAPILSVVLLVVMPLVDLALCRVLSAIMGGGSDEPGAGEAGMARTTFEPVLRRAIHAVTTVAGLLILADLWHVDVFSLAERGLGSRVTGAFLGIAVTLLVAWILWELVRTVIDRQLEAEGSSPSVQPGELGGPGGSRLRTLLPLFRVVLLGAILVMAVLSVLAALGVNILPLLAGAGVFGLAIGFGSQTLVRDIVSGAFFLMDDAFRLGEYIEAGDTKGIVEKIRIRSLHVRHHRGALNIIPYGEIKRLRNTSRDWMIMVLEFRLAIDTDLLMVKKIFKRVGEELAADPELARDLLEPLKSQGVTATDDSALLVRAKFMARPGSAPYLIRREAYTRILREFAANGVRFAGRNVTVLAPGQAPPALSAAGAAGASIDPPD